MPPAKHTQHYVDVQISLTALRQRFKTWDSLIEAIACAGITPSRVSFDYDRMSYSTVDSPDSFANAFNRAKFEAIVDYDSARVVASKRRAEHEAIEAAKPPPPPPLPPRDDAEDEEENPAPQKTKKQLREEAEERKKDRERLRAVLDAEHEAACRLRKLSNALKLGTLRIPLK